MLFDYLEQLVFQEVKDKRMIFEGNSEMPILFHHPVSLTIAQSVRIILQAKDEEICTQQPIGCLTSNSFLVDLSQLDDRDDIRSDDLGVWINKGVKSSFCHLQFKDDAVKNIEVLDYKPSVKHHLLYRLKHTYWVHSEDKRVSRRLFELEGM